MIETERVSFISTKEEHLINTHLDYGIYSYLIEKSNQDEDENGNRFNRPYILKSKIGKYSEMLKKINKHFENEELKISERTLKRRFTALVKSGILEKGKRGGKFHNRSIDGRGGESSNSSRNAIYLKDVGKQERSRSNNCSKIHRKVQQRGGLCG